jgi:hypothetical protein
MNVDKTIRGSAYAVVTVLAGIAAFISYNHIYEVVTSYGETGGVATLVPVVIDGLLVVASITMLDDARNDRRKHWLSRVALGVGIALTLAANVLHGWSSGPIGSIIAALPAVTLTISFELLMILIRRAAKAVKVEAPAVELAEAAPVEAPKVVEPAKVEAPKTTIRVSSVHVDAAKAFLAAFSGDVSKVTGKHLAGILPDMVARTRREVLRKAKAEMGVNVAQSAAKGAEPMLPGMTASVA